MASWAFSEGWKRFARCSAADFARIIPIELLLLTSEEPTRFGIGCLGSRLLSGTLSPDAARKLTDKNDESVEEVRRKAGLSGELEEVKLAGGYYKAFVELHIEQGPLLERERVPLGDRHEDCRASQRRGSRSKARAAMRAAC